MKYRKIATNQQTIAEIVEDIVFAHSPSTVVEAKLLREWYIANGLQLVLEVLGKTTVCYDVEGFDWQDIANKKKILINDHDHLLKQMHYENLQR